MTAAPMAIGVVDVLVSNTCGNRAGSSRRLSGPALGTFFLEIPFDFTVKLHLESSYHDLEL